MTLVTIDLGDVAGGHDPDDHVVIRAEAFRESPGGGVTSTAEVIIPLVDGVGEAEVEPGPVVVAFRCKAVADTREKRGVVPDEGPVGIEDVIAGDFVYTPAVVSAAVQARDDALAAAGRAEVAADRAGSAEQVGQWASEAQGAAQSTATDRGEVAADRQAVAQDKADVLALTTRAESAAGDAETHAELAEEKAGVATDAAGKATVSEQAAAQSASDADSDRVAAEQASTRAVQAEQVATGAATTATNKATDASLAADRAEQATAGKADLVGGKVPSSQIPEVALTKPFSVTSRAEMLALDAQEGDIAIISTGADKGSYILGSEPASDFASWLLMAVSADVPVQSVNGQVGNVNLGASDVGAAPASHTHSQYAEVSRVAALEAARTTSTVSPSGGTVTLSAPTEPVAGQMHIFEVLPTAETTITVSALGTLIDGVPESLTVRSGGVGLIGARWSSSKASWHVLTASVVV